MVGRITGRSMLLNSIMGKEVFPAKASVSLIVVFTHATPELHSAGTESRLPLLGWAREIQDSFKLEAPPMVIFAMDYARFPYPLGGAQDFWEALMTLDANTSPYCHRPFLESFDNGIEVEGYVQRIKGYLALYEPSFFEDQAEGQYNENKKKENRFSNLFRKSIKASSKSVDSIEPLPGGTSSSG
ncbi:hypothetical protein BGZ99_003021 [Dissophora globulifera]|uniref:Uncharacterized protein n=1 Tax=Dissophora globulifera TaxID=979702 RepID=A0A9P6RVI8_9FUNG|nr:hypothetical protein BGZ99_003021 [Dissophora globulifera]